MPRPNVKIVQGAYSAVSVSVATWEQGSVWLRLHDAAGNVFALGCMDAPTALLLERELHAAIGGPAEFHCNRLH